MFGEPARAKLDLEKFAEINEPRLYKLVKGCVDPQSDLRQIIKARVGAAIALERKPSEV
jgi:sister-chromatid-cohesion protein PDS5